MRDLIFPVEHHSEISLQAQLRRHLVDAILDNRLASDEPLPSCRRLAQSLGVSRNTVVLTYQALADEGLLVSRERVGYFVNPELSTVQRAAKAHVRDNIGPDQVPSALWKRLRLRPSEHTQITKPKSWQRYPYPFIYGQADPSLFPVAAWRLCSRQALGVTSIRSWTEDSVEADDALLVDEVRTRVLPRRGIKATPEQILMTMGGQNALYLIAQLLAGRDTTVGVENPGYVDARNIFSVTGARIKPLPVDHDGLVIDQRLAACDCVYVTPSHQSPTTVTLPLERRVALLEQAARSDIFVIEDDYEAETNFVHNPTTALKAMDRTGNVIYVGSFSKHLAPGLRIGYMVAAKELIGELRSLRRLMLRHPPTNNQRTVAHFISGGYYDALVQRLQRVYQQRWELMGAALTKYLPDSATTPSFGGTSYWVRGPDDLDSDVLAREALAEGIVIEPGSIHFISPKPPRNYFRLGFSSIADEHIAPGIERLAKLIHANT
ncbi:MAG: PLP-dependent aminotransferase family protein [Pseudomonadota bacterium]